MSYRVPTRSKKNAATRAQLGRRIRELRNRRGWSQNALASMCGLNVYHLGKIERGGANATLPTLLVITRSLHVTISSLFKGIL
jgi:transcriptional regulator with XRE-family HTH domain